MKLSVKHVIKAEFVLCIGIALCIMAGLEQWVSRLFYASFIALLPGVVFVLRGHRKNAGLLVTTVITTVVAVASGLLFGHGNFSFGALVYLFVFLALLLYIHILQEAEPERELCEFVMLAGILLAVIFPVAYFFFGVRTEEQYLQMNFNNSNLLGMWLTQTVLFALVGICYYSSWSAKIFCIGLAAANIYLLDLTGTRNAYLALILGAVLFVFSLCRKRGLSNWILALVVASPLIFLGLYMNFLEEWGNTEFLQWFTMESKDMDSRYAMWEATLYNMRSGWLTGKYFLLCGNVHNSHLTLLSSYGAVALCLTMWYLYSTLRRVNNACVSPFQNLCVIAFCVTIFMGNAEGALFSGALGLYIPACSFLLLAKYVRPEGQTQKMLFSKVKFV